MARHGSVREVVAVLEEIGAEEIPIMVGGQVHREDAEALRDVGVAGVFTPGHTMAEVVTWLEETTGKSVGGPVG